MDDHLDLDLDCNWDDLVKSTSNFYSEIPAIFMQHCRCKAFLSHKPVNFYISSAKGVKSRNVHKNKCHLDILYPFGMCNSTIILAYILHVFAIPSYIQHLIPLYSFGDLHGSCAMISQPFSRALEFTAVVPVHIMVDFLKFIFSTVSMRMTLS